MTWEEIKMELDRIEEKKQRVYIHYRIGQGTRAIVIGGDSRMDCVGYRYAWNIDPKSIRLVIKEYIEYRSGTLVAIKCSIPITEIIKIDDFPFLI